MNNRDNEDLTARLNAILASAYSGGNSFAARKARAEIQDRDDKGQFAEMYGEMRFVMLKNGITPVSMIARYVGSVGDGSNMGWFYVPEGDKNFAAGFYKLPVDQASSDIVAVLDESYLEGKGVKPGQAQGQIGMLNADDLEFTSAPPDFIEHPEIEGAFISEDGDISIEPNEFGGWDVVDNIDPQNSVQSVDDLGQTMKAVHAIDMTRKDYVPTAWDKKAMADAQLSRARDLANATPVATLPVDATPEAPKADPAGLTNAELESEGSKLFDSKTGLAFPLADKERASAILDELDARAELEPEGYEGDWFSDNPDFVRDSSKSKAPATPVAKIPSTETKNPFGLEGDVTFRDADGNRISRNNLWDLAVGTEIDAQQLLPGNRMGKANFVREDAGWRNTDTGELFTQDKQGQAPVAEIPTADTVSEDELAELRELQRRAIADGGLSVSFAEGAAPTDGFMVSFEGKDNDLGIISKADFEDAEKGPRAIFNFLMDNQEFLDGEGNFFGVWFDNDENIYDTDGNVTGTKPEAERNPRYFLDVSQNVADRQEAIDLGVERNQVAIWDVIKQESISTGGTGEGKKDGTDSTPGGEDGSGSDGDSKDSLGESEQEVGGFNVKSDADLLTGDVAEKIVDFIARGDEQATDRVGNLYLSTDIVEDAGMQWIVSYEDADGNTREFVGYLPVDTAGNILQSVDVRADVLAEIKSQSKEMDATPTGDIQSPVEILRDPSIVSDMALFIANAGDGLFDSIRGLNVSTSLDGEGMLVWSANFTSPDGVIHEYSGNFQLNTAGEIFLPNNTTLEAEIRGELEAQLEAEARSIIQGRKTPINVPAVPTSATADSDMYLNQIEQLIQQYNEQADPNESIEEGFARIRKLMGDVQNMKQVIWQQLEVAEATGNAGELTRLRQRFGMLSAAEAYVASHLAEEIDFDLAPTREYILENMRLISVERYTGLFRNGDISSAKAAYLAPNGISYILEFDNGQIIARVENFGDFEQSGSMGEYLKTDMGFREAGHLHMHSGVGYGKDEPDGDFNELFPIPVHNEADVSIITPSHIEIGKEAFKTLGSAMHVMAQAMVEANGGIYRHSTYLLAPGRRTVLRLNGQDPNMAPYVMREKVMEGLDAPTAELLRSLGFNSQLSTDDRGTASQTWWGDFDRTINQPLNVLARYYKENYGGDPASSGGVEYPAYLDEYVKQRGMEDFEFFSILDKFHELNYEGRDVEEFVATARELADDIERTFSESSVYIDSGGHDGETSVEIEIDAYQLVRNLRTIADALAAGRLGENTIERVNLVGNTVLRYEGENVFASEQETSEIPPAPPIMAGSTQFNNPINPIDIRVARLLDDLSVDELKDALKDALENGIFRVVTDKYSLPTTVLRNALALRGEDADMFVAKIVDASYGGSNEDALKAYRQEYADVLREGVGDVSRPAGDGIGPAEFDDSESFEIRRAVSRATYGEQQSATVEKYKKALQNGEDSIDFLVTNYQNSYRFGERYVPIPLSMVRGSLADYGVDMDSIDDEFQKNEDVKTTIAENNDMTVDEATPTYRTDWRSAIRSGTEEYNFIVFTDRRGVVQRFERYDGKWKNVDESNGKGLTDDQMVRKIERSADRSLEMFIDSGFAPDEDDNEYDETKYVFSFGDDSDNVAEVTGDTAVALDAWRHVTGGDLAALKALEEAGVKVNIMDFIEENIGGERRGDENDELIVQSVDWTALDGTKYRYEVVVTRTPDEYFYTYVRQINLTKNTAQSASVGLISQSAYALLNAHQTEMRKFFASFYTSAGPTGWFAGNATGRRRKNDIFNEETNSWMHQKEMKTNPQLLANLRRLLGEETASNVDVRKAQNALMKDIVVNLARYRYNERKMRMAAEHITKRHGVMVTPEYMYKVAEAYDAHARNQHNLDTFGTWISGDQRTPLDAGDRVQHVSGRLGTVRKRLGWVDSLGRYRYTDYVEVQWDKTDERDTFISWTTSRNNTLIQTADGTDGSERVTYNTSYEDPRAEYGTDVNSSEQVPVPTYEHVVAPPIVDGLDYVTVTRDENSNLVLPNGVVIPEIPVGAEIDVKREWPDTLAEGDFIFVLNGDLETVSAPIIQYGVDGAPEGGVAHNVAIRQEGGAYTVRTIVYPASEMGTTVSAHSFFYPNQQADGPSPAQLNEILELLGTKDLPNRPQFGVMNYYLGIMDGQDMSGIYSAEEVSEIIQELRALPNRDINRADETARVAQALADLAERDGSANQADSMQTIADASLIVASNGTGDVVETEAPVPAELTEEQRRANLVQRLEKHYEDLTALETILGKSQVDLISALWASGEFDQGEIERYNEIFFNYRYGIQALDELLVDSDSYAEAIDEMGPNGLKNAENSMDAALIRAEIILEQVIPRLATYYDNMTPDLQEKYTILRNLDRESSLSDLGQIQALRAKIEGLNDVISASYDGQVSPRQQLSGELLEQFKQGYTVYAVANDADLNSPEGSINKVEFITLPNGRKAVLKTFGGEQVSPEDEVNGELTSYRMFEALGVTSLAVAATVLPSGELAVIVEMFEGQTMSRLPELDVSDVLDNPASPMVALFDVVGGNPDRHSGNYMFSRDLSQMMPIDNGYMYQSMSPYEASMRESLRQDRARHERGIDAYNHANFPEAARREVQMTTAFQKMVADYLDGDQTYITDDNVRTFDERLRSLREMYVSMGMEDIYKDLLKSIGILLGVSP